MKISTWLNKKLAEHERRSNEKSLKYWQERIAELEPKLATYKQYAKLYEDALK
jgi:hypothetical protein